MQMDAFMQSSPFPPYEEASSPPVGEKCIVEAMCEDKLCLRWRRSGGWGGSYSAISMKCNICPRGVVCFLSLAKYYVRGLCRA